jgi:hypothetical protein
MTKTDEQLIEELMALAKSGGPRPTGELGEALDRFTTLLAETEDLNQYIERKVQLMSALNAVIQNDDDDEENYTDPIRREILVAEVAMLRAVVNFGSSVAALCDLTSNAKSLSDVDVAGQYQQTNRAV